MDSLIKKAKRGNPREKSYFDYDSDEEDEMKSEMGGGQGVIDEVTHGGEEEVYKVVKGG